MGTMNESEARRAALTAAVEVNKTWHMESPNAVLAVAAQFETWLTRDSQDEHGHPLKVIASSTPEHTVPATSTPEHTVPAFPLTAWARKQRQESTTPTASVRGAGTPQTGACEACPHPRSAHSDRGCFAAGWDGDDMCPCTLPPKFTARTRGSRFCSVCEHGPHGAGNCGGGEAGDRACDCNGLTVTATNYLAQASTPPSTLPDTASTVQFVHDEDGPVLAGELYPDAYCAGWARGRSVTDGCKHRRTEHDAHGCTVGRGKEGSCPCERGDGK